jgi:hypothetical protein
MVVSLYSGWIPFFTEDSFGISSHSLSAPQIKLL